MRYKIALTRSDEGVSVSVVMVKLDSHAAPLAHCALYHKMWALQSMGAPETGASDNHLAKETATC